MFKFGQALLAAAALAVTVGSAQATTYFFTDPGKATGSLDTSTGELILTALIANPTDVASTISGLTINFSAAPATVSLTSQDGQLINVPKDGPGTTISGDPVNWTLTKTASQLIFDANHSCAVGGGAPCDLIIGPGGPGNYDNANGSIGSHSPFILQTGTFQLSDIKDLVVTSLRIAYGTGPTLSGSLNPTCSPTGGDCATPPVVPLPPAAILFGSALAGIGGLLGARRRRRAPAGITNS